MRSRGRGRGGDETVERVVVAHHIVEFRTVGGDGVRVTEYDRNGYARMRRGGPLANRGTGAQGGHVEERAEGIRTNFSSASG